MEPGSFKDYICRSMFIKRQQADIMRHVSNVQSNLGNSEKTSSTLHKFMELSLPYIYASQEREDELTKATRIMEEYANKVIEFKIPEKERLKGINNPFEVTDKLSVNKR